MKYVIDSSVAFKWAVPEADSDKAIALRDQFRRGADELIAPDVFPIELAHALTRAERQGRISVSQAMHLLADVLQTAPDLQPSLPLLPRAVEISSQTRVGVYDCLYTALAEREACALVTADRRLVNVLQTGFPFLVDLATMP
jgi:predicted nucleic acid-binding protein